MLETLFGNPHYKLVSLLVAVLAWLYVQSDEVATGQVNARVEWELAEGLVSVRPLPRTVALRVKGTRAAIRKARTQLALVMPVDLRQAGPGEHNVDFAPFAVNGLETNLEILSRTPSGIRVQLDKQVTRRIELKTRVVGEPADGYAVRRVKLQPAVVQVSGPASVVNELQEIPTEPIDVAGLMADLDVPVRLSLPASITAVLAEEVKAEVSMIALNEPRVFADVPVEVWGGRGTVTPDVAEVELTGPSTLVRDLSAEDLVVFVHPPGETGSARVTWGDGGPGKVRVLHGAGKDVRATNVTPSTFEVTR
ncbi:MAG: hypothetical protein KC656_22870 [Myxococcales bacterium]|nr:hypothetical protein [Myxococcales bacterium]MCB9667851.1 hypothetical protein [Alphaproteobacteria bacterium]MCB9690505.1 hypothetical protein [Alphaproteobacteria bacterium]